MQALGSLVEGDESEAYGISGDGSTVVGNASGQAFVWTAETGMVGIGNLGMGKRGAAYGASTNGSIVVGYGRNANNKDEAFMWTEETGLMSLAPAGLGQYKTKAYGVTDDGSMIFGEYNKKAALWLEDGGWILLEEYLSEQGIVLDGCDLDTISAISADGSYISGYGEDAHGNDIIWSINLSPVPVPGTLFLMGSGLLGLAGLRRKNS